VPEKCFEAETSEPPQGERFFPEFWHKSLKTPVTTSKRTRWKSESGKHATYARGKASSPVRDAENAAVFLTQTSI
jgi:hypothetical protein